MFLIIPVEDLNSVDLNCWGSKLEYNKNFPLKTNVHFIEVQNRSNIKVLVWERGAGPTLACGTGACACLVTAFLLNLTDSKVNIYLPGGRLEINWPTLSSSIYMSGSAYSIFNGNIKKSDNSTFYGILSST